jgi:hypothetical protein
MFRNNTLIDQLAARGDQALPQLRGLPSTLFYQSRSLKDSALTQHALVAMLHEVVQDGA